MSGRGGQERAGSIADFHGGGSAQHFRQGSLSLAIFIPEGWLTIAQRFSVGTNDK